MIFGNLGCLALGFVALRFEVVFEARSGRRKNRAKKPKKTQKAIFLSRAPLYGTCLGRDYREGKHENLMRRLQQGHSMLVSGV